MRKMRESNQQNNETPVRMKALRWAHSGGNDSFERQRLLEEALCSGGQGGNTPLQSVMETSCCWLLTIFVDRGSMAIM